MRVKIFSVLILGLFYWTGCGHIEANYPKTKVKSPKTLPESFNIQGDDKPMVWREEAAIHGFMNRWEQSNVMVERMRDFADMGSSSAGADARLFEPMGKKGCSHVTMMVYAAKDVERIIRKGDFLFHFRDGTTAEDLGVFLY